MGVIGLIIKIKQKLKMVLVKSRWLTQLIHNYYYIFNKLKYSQYIFERKDIDLFEIHKICANMPYPGSEMVFDNNVYGIGNTLKKFSGFKGQINAYIEHGLYFGNHIDDNQWYASKIVTFSNQRKKHLLDRNVNKDVHVIGPYINYADILFSSEYMRTLKTNLGKTLLIFPVHSSTNIDTTYDIVNFTKQINQIKEDYSFDSILVCLYFKDVFNKKLVNYYTSNGYKICSAGHKWDKHFLNRLKTIISLADKTISNDVGTNIGYCVSLRKPHTILKSEIQYTPDNDIGIDQIKGEKKKERLLEIEEVKNGFMKTDGSIYDKIDSHQTKLINEYWGLDSIKTKNELFSILS